MSKLVGVIDGRKIYDDHPILAELQRRAEFHAVWSGSVTVKRRCQYCGRIYDTGNTCVSCGAPVRDE